MTKASYATPTVTRVELAPTQAVLSLCSVAAIMAGSSFDSSGSLCYDGSVYHPGASGSSSGEVCQKFEAGDNVAGS